MEEKIMRLKSSDKVLQITCLVMGLILVGMVLYISWVNAGFRQTMKEALNNSSTAIYIDKINYGKIKIMEEEVAIYNEEQQDVPMIQYTIYKIKKDKYVLMSYLSFLHDLMTLKNDMLAAIKDMSERRGEEIYEFTFVYATQEQKDLYEMVIDQFEEARGAYNLQEVKQEGEEATIVTISFENPFMGAYANALMFFSCNLQKYLLKYNK